MFPLTALPSDVVVNAAPVTGLLPANTGEASAITTNAITTASGSARRTLLRINPSLPFVAWFTCVHAWLFLLRFQNGVRRWRPRCRACRRAGRLEQCDPYTPN